MLIFIFYSLKFESPNSSRVEHSMEGMLPHERLYTREYTHAMVSHWLSYGSQIQTLASYRVAIICKIPYLLTRYIKNVGSGQPLAPGPHPPPPPVATQRGMIAVKTTSKVIITPRGFMAAWRD